MLTLTCSNSINGDGHSKLEEGENPCGPQSSQSTSPAPILTVGEKGLPATFPQHLPAPQSPDSLNYHRKRKEKPVSSVPYCSPPSAGNLRAPQDGRNKRRTWGAAPCQKAMAGTIEPPCKLLGTNSDRAKVTPSVLHNLDVCPQDNV